MFFVFCGACNFCFGDSHGGKNWGCEMAGRMGVVNWREEWGLRNGGKNGGCEMAGRIGVAKWREELGLRNGGKNWGCEMAGRNSM